MATKLKPVLIVEDEAIMRESLRDWLKDEGYQVETVEQGEEALKAITEREFGIVLLDMRLPGKDGLEVLREVKTQSPQLKGIIITAYPSVETAVEAMKIGAVDYLTKPLDLNNLEELIRDILGPVQVEIKSKTIMEAAIVEPVTMAVEEVKPKAASLERLKEPPSTRGFCHYAFKHDVSYLLCSRLFQCSSCEFNQMTEDAPAKAGDATIGSIPMSR